MTMEQRKADIAAGMSLKEIDEKYKAEKEAKILEKDVNKAAKN